MEWPELYFEILYKMIRLQNEKLLHEISVIEKIPLKELKKSYLPSRKNMKIYIKQLLNSSS